MADVNLQHATHRSPRAGFDAMARIFAASLSEAAVAAGAGVLAILGLVGVDPTAMVAIATIALGGSLLIESAGFASRVSQLEHMVGRRYRAAGVGTGISAEVAGGLTGVTLGVLALIGIAPMTLVSVSAIVFGGTLLFGGGAEAELEQLLAAGAAGEPEACPYAHRGVSAMTGSSLLVGLGAGTLGILALATSGHVLTFILVAHLAVAVALTLSGSAQGAQMGLRPE